MFAQIREQIQARIANGALAPGMRLPPVRSLAQQLGVNQITVAKAYRELAEKRLVEGRRGGGSFIRDHEKHAPAPVSDKATRPLLAQRLFDLAHAPGVIAFSSNYPVIDRQAADAFGRCLADVATGSMMANCFSYDPPLGRAALRQQIELLLRDDGVEAEADNILITSGGQQAISLSTRAMIEPGAPVILEQPSYYGAINALRGVHARLLPVPIEHDGLNLDLVERHLIRDKARFIYTNPTFQNPTGITMSLEKRRALLALARRYGAVILEDDHSHELRFSGEPVPSIRSLADRDDRVLYARGFGKTILPGSRIGYLVVPDALRQKLMLAKAQADLHGNGAIQESVALFLARKHHVPTIKRMRDRYRERQQTVYRCLARDMPDGTVINHPEGGLSFWLTLPGGADISELYYRAVRRGVAFVAGDAFYTSSLHPRSLRISFGFNKAEELEEGVMRLCSVVKDLLSPRSGRTLVMM